MQVAIEKLKSVIAKKNYIWYEDRPNIIAIRTKLQVPDVFNDVLCLVWKQAVMPEGLSDTAKQEFLNKHLFVGSDGKPLKVDGDFGPKSQYAYSEYLKVAGKDRMVTSIITTEPGTTYQKKLLNAKGVWVMMPAQMVDAYTPGFHQGKPDHRCLRSTGKIYGLREDDKDGILFNDKDAKPEWADGTTIGANIHGAVHKDNIDLTTTVGPWSAGCQVHSRWSAKEFMMDVCEKIYSNIKKFTYTLITEDDFN